MPTLSATCFIFFSSMLRAISISDFIYRVFSLNNNFVFLKVAKIQKRRENAGI
jgi:hypothetical protein